MVLARRDNIISKTCVGHERKFMGIKKKPKNTSATQTCLLEPSPPRLKFKMMNVLPVQGHVTRLKLGTGSQVNILPVRKLKKIIGSNPCMDPCTHKLVSYSENNLTVLGTAKLPVKYKANVEKDLTFHIVDTNQPGLLGLRSSQDLGLIKVVMMTDAEEERSKLNADVKSDKSPQQLKEEVMQKYANVFTGLGRLEKPYHIEVDPTVTPVVNPPRMIPAAVRDRVKTELEDMEKMNVELFFK